MDNKKTGSNNRQSYRNEAGDTGREGYNGRFGSSGGAGNRRPTGSYRSQPSGTYRTRAGYGEGRAERPAGYHAPRHTQDTNRTTRRETDYVPQHTRRPAAASTRSVPPRRSSSSAHIPESVRARREQLRRQRILVAAIAGVVLVIAIVIIVLSSRGRGEGKGYVAPIVATKDISQDATPMPTGAPLAADDAVAAMAAVSAQPTEISAAPTSAPVTEVTAAPTAVAVASAAPTAVAQAAAAPTAAAQAAAVPAQGSRSAVIRVVGDIMVTDEQLEYALEPDGSYDFSESFTYINDSMAAADYTMANLETTIGKYNGKAYSGYPCFNSPKELLLAVQASGIDYLSLANNHMLDRYFDGMKNTVGYVEYLNFDFSGAYRTQEERDTPNIFTVNGIKVGFVNYTHTTNTQEKVCDPAAISYGVPYLYESDIEGDIQKTKAAGAEVIIAWPHWGTEYTHTPDDTQVKYAKRLAAAGADVILGNHSHNIQPMGYLTPGGETGTVGDVFTIFSIGNFLSSLSSQDCDFSIIVQFTLKEQADGSFAATDVGYVPIFSWVHDNMVQIVPSGMYLDSPPSGMDDSTWSRMKKTYQATVDLYGTDQFKLMKQ